MKTTKIILAAVAAIVTVTIASAFVPSHNDITIESVDGTTIGINLNPTQVKALYSLMPLEYRQMLKSSYSRFRTRAVSVKDGLRFDVDGVSVVKTSSDEADTYELSGNFAPYGRHSVTFKVAPTSVFISQMDDILLALN